MGIKVLGTPSKEEIMSMNREYTQTKFPVVKALPWKVVFSGVTYENKPVPLDGIDLISKFLIFTPNHRSDGFTALAHPYFDELRLPKIHIAIWQGTSTAVQSDGGRGQIC